MRRVISLLVFLILTFLSVSTAAAGAENTWKKTGMDGANVSVYVSPNYGQDHSIFALVDQDLYLSTDEGRHWDKSGELPVWQVRTEQDNNFYSLRGADLKTLAIYKYNPDVEDKWAKICDVPAGTQAFTVMTDGNIMVAMPRTDRTAWQMQRTASPGSFWQDSNFNSGGKFLESTADGKVFTREEGTYRIARSVNYGVSWREISSTYEVEQMFIPPACSGSDRMFAIINNTSVSYSTDGSVYWIECVKGIRDNSYLVSLTFSPGYKTDHTVYAADREGRVFVSNNNGDSWKSLGVLLSEGTSLNNLAVTPEGGILAGTKNGIYEITSFIPPDELITASFSIGKNTYSIGDDVWLMDTTPFVDNDRTYVPVRFLAYSMGINDDASVVWDEVRNQVTLVKNGTVVKITMGKNTLLVNNQPVTMDVQPQNRDGRIFLPARWVAEAFGANVSWDNEKKLVVITYAK
jgi:hypothetical protein